MKVKEFIDSFNYAISGILAALKLEKSLRVHYIAAITVMIASTLFNLSRIEFMILLFAVVLVVVLEMVNTAIEKTIDMITREYHPLARVVKDISAGAVLIATFNAVIVGYLLFYDRLNPFKDLIILKIKNSEIHLTFVALLLVVLLIIGFKSKFYKGHGTHFQGGIVSGHSAVAFCIATIISVISESLLIITLSFGLALLVAESRVEGKIHSLLEVVLGGVLGILVGIFIFKVIG
ncbi:MAG: diacylglycerol kinase [Gudongella sp.]|nr:diacylglycerol kinase [Gudongella sp.]